MTLLAKNGSTPMTHPTTPWLHKTAREFFSGINWENHPPEVQELTLAATTDGDNTALSLLLTVQQFFSIVNWDGTAVAPTPLPLAVEQESPMMGGSPSLTLDDFSDLF